MSNTGYRNSGNRNTGDDNTGDYNTGDRNSGHKNTGSWNTGSWNSGFFNTATPNIISVFNQPVLREAWDKAKRPNFIYFEIKKFESYKEAFQRSYKEASKEDQELVKQLPNFDAEIFYEISGIDLREKSKKEYIFELTCEEFEKVKQVLERGE